MTEESTPSSLRSQVTVLTEHLGGKGYEPEVNSHGDVYFRCAGKYYYIEFDELDDTYLTLIAYNIAPDGAKIRARKITRLAAQLTTEGKLCKVRVNPSKSVDVMAETRYQQMEHFTAILPILIDNLDFFVLEFRRRFEVLQEQEARLLQFGVPDESHNSPNTSTPSDL